MKFTLIFQKFWLGAGLCLSMASTILASEPYPFEYWALRDVVSNVRVSPDGKHVVLAHGNDPSCGFIVFSDANRVKLRGPLGRNAHASFQQGRLIVRDDDGVRTFNLE